VTSAGPGGSPPSAADELLLSAVAADGEAYRHLFEGRPEEARASLQEAARRYRASWEAAPPRSFGRLVAGLKSAIIAGDPAEAAAYVRGQLADAALGGDFAQPDSCDSPTSCYALAVAALAEGDDELAGRAVEGMREGDAAFGRTADAIAALAGRDREGYRVAVEAIVRDFEGRDRHLTGVPIADTAMMLQALAEPREMAVALSSPLLPASG